MDRQRRRIHSVDYTGQRTPMAWRHRDMNYSTHNTRPSSPSLTSTSTDDREEVPMVRHSGGGPRYSNRADRNFYPHHADNYAMGTLRNGTLRSTRSVPALALATWDGEPCPVHGHGPHFYPPCPPPGGTLRRYGSMFDMRSPYYAPSAVVPPPHAVLLHPPHQPTLERKSFHGSVPVLAPHSYPMPPPPTPIPPQFLPPMMRPRPMVFPAGAEPLPVRDPYKFRAPPPGYSSKSEDSYSVDQVCCKGHLIVLWIILGVVTVGVILGIILGITIS